MKRILYIFLVISLLSCKKRSAAQGDFTDIGDTTQVKIDTQFNIIRVGSGSGKDLFIDGTGKDYPENTIIKIKGGTYRYIEIKHIRGSEKSPVRIENEGLVESSGEISLENLHFVILSGKGTKEIEKGFVLQNNAYRAVQMRGHISNFTLEYFRFINIGDNVITYQFNEVLDGTPQSYAENIAFKHIDCENTGQFYSGAGSVDNREGIKGLIKNLEISYLDFRNSPYVGSVVWIGNAEGYDIHHNRINNINTLNDNHNGIFLLTGNGRFHHNHVSNHQGNAVRAFGHSIGNQPKEVLIYNNIVYNSRKYSAFEVQSFDHNVIPGRSTFVNVLVFNNTCGNINTSKDWVGAIIDVYSLKGGTCRIFNNLGFSFPEADMIWTQHSDLIPQGSNNLYFSTSQSAGIIDETAFRLATSSKAKGSGLEHSLLTDDFYGILRNKKPSVGAVE